MSMHKSGFVGRGEGYVTRIMKSKDRERRKEGTHFTTFLICSAIEEGGYQMYNLLIIFIGNLPYKVIVEWQNSIKSFLNEGGKLRYK